MSLLLVFLINLTNSHPLFGDPGASSSPRSSTSGFQKAVPTSVGGQSHSFLPKSRSVPESPRSSTSGFQRAIPTSVSSRSPSFLPQSRSVSPNFHETSVSPGVHPVSVPESPSTSAGEFRKASVPSVPRSDRFDTPEARQRDAIQRETRLHANTDEHERASRLASLKETQNELDLELNKALSAYSDSQRSNDKVAARFIKARQRAEKLQANYDKGLELYNKARGSEKKRLGTQVNQAKEQLDSALSEREAARIEAVKAKDHIKETEGILRNVEQRVDLNVIKIRVYEPSYGVSAGRVFDESELPTEKVVANAIEVKEKVEATMKKTVDACSVQKGSVWSLSDGDEQEDAINWLRSSLKETWNAHWKGHPEKMQTKEDFEQFLTEAQFISFLITKKINSIPIMAYRKLGPLYQSIMEEFEKDGPEKTLLKIDRLLELAALQRL